MGAGLQILITPVATYEPPLLTIEQGEVIIHAAKNFTPGGRL
jgi:hypothetical protein